MKKIGKVIILGITLLIMNQLEVGASDKVPIGTIQSYSGVKLPSGYIEANGQAISREEYNVLFQVIGTTYGRGNGSTTFNVPDLRKRVVVGQSSENEFNTLGKTGGEENHTLTVEEMPSHTHTFTGTATASGNNSSTPSATFTGNSVTTSTGGEHTHSIPALSGTALTAGEHTHNINTLWAGNSTGGGKYTIDGYPRTNASGQYSRNTETAGAHSHSVTTNTSTTGSNGSHNHTVTATGSVTLKDTTHTHSVTAKGTNSNTGGNRAHNNMQPYIVLKYMIKVK